MGPPQPARDPDRGRRRLLKSQSDAALAAKRKSHQERAAALVGTRDLAWHLRRSQVQVLPRKMATSASADALLAPLRAARGGGAAAAARLGKGGGGGSRLLRPTASSSLGTGARPRSRRRRATPRRSSRRRSASRASSATRPGLRRRGREAARVAAASRRGARERRARAGPRAGRRGGPRLANDRSPRSLDSADPFVVDASRDDATRSPRSVVVGRLVGRTIDALGAGDYGTAAASQPRPYAVEALVGDGHVLVPHAGLGPRRSEALVHALGGDAAPPVTQLDCRANGLESGSCARLLAACLRRASLEVLRLSANDVSDGAMRRIVAFVGAEGCPLVDLQLARAKLLDARGLPAALLRPWQSALQILDVSRNDLTRFVDDDGVRAYDAYSGVAGAPAGAAAPAPRRADGGARKAVRLAEAKAAPESDDDDDDDDARRRRHKEKESMTTQEARERTSQLLADRIFAEASYERKLERDKKTFRVDFAAFLPYWHLVQYGSGKKANRAYTHLLSTLKHVLRILRLSGPEARARSTTGAGSAPLVADVYVSVLRRALDGRGRALDVLLDVVPTPAGAPAPDKERVKEKPRGCRMTAADVRTALFGKDATKDAATWDAPLFKRLAFDDLLRTLWLRADALSDEGDATLDDVLELALDFAFECAASAQEKLVQRFEDEEHAKGKVDWYAFDLILDDFDMGPGDGTVEGEAASKAEKLELFKEALGVDELEEQDLVLTDAKRFAMTLWKAGKFKQLRKHEVVAEAPVEAVVERPRGLTNGNLGLALRVLDLSWNRLHVADELRVLVSVCPNLEVLDASYNAFGDGGVVAILAAADFSPEPSNFVALKLRGNGDGGGVFEARPLALDMDDCAVDADVPSDGSVPPTYDPDARRLDDASGGAARPATTAPDVGVALRNALRAVARDNALRFESLEWCRTAASGNERRDERERTWLPVKLTRGAMPSVGHTRAEPVRVAGGHAPSPPYLKLDLEDPANELFLKTNPNAAPLGDRAFVVPRTGTMRFKLAYAPRQPSY
ncbi:hypothetical protein JL722_11344 [Aureococcus anophagefferens]|nr:hypothetical protein JL722_11344 [Aureococcus anophagefferens]